MNNQNEIDIERYKNNLGFYSIPREIWNKLAPSDQAMIKKMNGTVRRKREREVPIEDKHRNSPSVTQRRQPVEESDRKRQKTVQFQSTNKYNDDDNQDNDIVDEEGTKSITTRRDIIRFKINE